MQILSLHLKNIKSHRDTLLSFSPGINVLAGPNGVGKSTVFEAIGYALFGVDARDFVTNVDRFLTIGAKRGEITVTFRTGADDTWRVTRTVGTPARWLLARENEGLYEVEEHARIEETGARIAELLGLANGRPLAEQFRLVIGPFQHEFLGPFVIRQPTKRQEAFDEILGIDAWRKTYKGTSTLLAAVQEKVRLLETAVKGKQEQIAILPDKIAELTANGKELALREEEVRLKEISCADLAKRLAELESGDKIIATLENDLRVLATRIKDGNGKIDDQMLRVGESQRAWQIVAEARGGKEAFDRVEARLAGLRQQEQQRRLLEREIADLEKQALTLSQKLEHERAEIATIELQLATEEEKLAAARKELQPDPGLVARSARVSAIRKEVEMLKGERAILNGRRESLQEGEGKLAEGICPFLQEECRTFVGTAPRDFFTTRISDLERQAAALDERIRLVEGQLGEAESAEREMNNRAIRLQELNNQAAGLEERRVKNRVRASGLEGRARQQADAAEQVKGRMDALKAFAALDESIVLAEKERLRFQPARDAYAVNLNSAGELDSRKQSLRKMQDLLAQLSHDHAVKQAELAGKMEGFQPGLLQQTRQENVQLAAAMATVRQQIVDLGRNGERLHAEIQQLTRIREEIETVQAEIAAFGEKEKLVRFLRNQVFKNVSAQLSERFREEISLRADRIYRTIAETDEELYWSDNYQIVLKDMQDGCIRERSDDQLSGGQTMSAVVALRLALLQTIGARIAFFDEPTSNLDAARRENLALAFRAIDTGREEVTEHWYDQLFLISHDVAFAEITDQTIQLGG
jgi:exonuclease SbcC